MGYAPDGRRRLVLRDVQDRVYNEAGDGLGVVLVEGAAAGAWRRPSLAGPVLGAWIWTSSSAPAPRS